MREIARTNRSDACEGTIYSWQEYSFIYDALFFSRHFVVDDD